MIPRRAAVSLVAFFLLVGSAHAGTTHTVRRGQTLYSIARSYGLSVQALARANRITDLSQITEGQRLVIPQTKSAAAPRADAEPARAGRAEAGPASAGRPDTGKADAGRASKGQVAGRAGGSKSDAGPPVAGKADAGRAGARRAVTGRKITPPKRPDVPSAVRAFSTSMQRPVDGPIISPFAAPRRGGKRWHKGVDIKSPEGAPIRAVADGVVVMAQESHGGFGRLVTIDHGEGITTFYGHNSRNLVQEGQRVAAGEVIALVGRTGNASCDHLHFELRKDGAAVDPARLLPDARTASVETRSLPERPREPAARPAVTRARYPSERGKGPPPE